MTVEASHTQMLLDQFDAACRELAQTIEDVPDAQWLAPTVGDGRQINVVAHHAASAHRYVADMVQAMAAGQPASMGMDQIHAGNAEHARQFGACTKSETLEQHERCSAHAREVLRGFDEATLAHRGELLAGRPMTVEQAIQGILIGHPRDHAATIRSTLSASPA
jgi:hypothetical protein